MSSKTNPAAMMIVQMTFLPKRVTSLRNIIDRVPNERNCGTYTEQLVDLDRHPRFRSSIMIWGMRRCITAVQSRRMVEGSSEASTPIKRG
jgi:hypothetical protein